MRKLQVIILFGLITTVGCNPKQGPQKNQLMSLDSLANGKDVVMVDSKTAIKPEEQIKDLKDLPNITQADLDTLKTSTNEIRLVKTGEALSPAEK